LDGASCIGTVRISITISPEAFTAKTFGLRLVTFHSSSLGVHPSASYSIEQFTPARHPPK
jgi:hypothetical protein